MRQRWLGGAGALNEEMVLYREVVRRNNFLICFAINVIRRERMLETTQKYLLRMASPQGEAMRSRYFSLNIVTFCMRC